MVDTTLRHPEQAAVSTAPALTVSRLAFLDHLRAALVTLVVVHHVALVYGAGAPFYYVEPPLNDPLAFVVLLVFVLCNQAWFMGALFLLAGYFTPSSFDRKGPAAYLRERLLRLGVPLLLFVFVLGPLSAVGYWQMPASLTGITTPLTWQAYPYLLGMGPLWFAALLLIFAGGYAAWRGLTGSRIPAPRVDSPPPRALGIVGFILGLALVSYLLRMLIPLGQDVLGFPTLAYLPQYLSFFILGAVATRRGWLDALPRALGGAGALAALVATVILLPLALSGRLFSLAVSETGAFVGHGTWQSAVYALWDPIVAVGMGLAAITFFRRWFDRESRLGRFLARQSYAVYIFHTPIVVFVALALRGIALGPLATFGLASLIVIPLCFLVAALVRRLPLATRVL